MHEHFGPESVKVQVTSTVTQHLPTVSWITENVGTQESLEFIRGTVAPSALFAAGIPSKNIEWVDTQWRRLLRPALGYEPAIGECRKPPNISLAEQSCQLPWSEEVKSVNSAMSARLASVSGPVTLPRRLMKNLQLKGVSPSIVKSKFIFHRKNNKRARAKCQTAQMLAVRKQKAAGMKLAPTSGTRLYCELSTGKFPCVAHRGA